MKGSHLNQQQDWSKGHTTTPKYLLHINHQLSTLSSGTEEAQKCRNRKGAPISQFNLTGLVSLPIFSFICALLFYLCYGYIFPFSLKHLLNFSTLLGTLPL